MSRSNSNPHIESPPITKEEVEARAARQANHLLTGIAEPGPNDCLFGRGNGVNNHVGNGKYRKIVEDKRGKYWASNRLNKPLVAMEIVTEWRALDPPGRFLMQDDETKLWKDVGDEKARQKARKALGKPHPSWGADAKSLPDQSTQPLQHQVAHVPSRESFQFNHPSHQQIMIPAQPSVVDELLKQVTAEQMMMAEQIMMSNYSIQQLLDGAAVHQSRVSGGCGPPTFTVDGLMRSSKKQRHQLSLPEARQQQPLSPEAQHQSDDNELNHQLICPKCSDEGVINVIGSGAVCMTHGEAKAGAAEGCKKERAQKEEVRQRHGARKTRNFVEDQRGNGRLTHPSQKTAEQINGNIAQMENSLLYLRCKECNERQSLCRTHRMINTSNISRGSKMGGAEGDAGVITKNVTKKQSPVKTYLCKFEGGCENRAVRGGVCIKHGAGHTRCKFEGGCENKAVRGGLCVRHGGVTVCKFEGCSNQVQRHGLCRKHGGWVTCRSEGCNNQALRQGLCTRHGAFNENRRHVPSSTGDGDLSHEDQMELERAMAMFSARATLNHSTLESPSPDADVTSDGWLEV